MHEIKAELKELTAFIKDGLKKVDIPGKKEEVEKLNKEMAAPGFWDDSDKAQEISQKAANITKTIDIWEGIIGETDELNGLLPEIHPEKDPEAAEEFVSMVKKLGERWKKLEISTFLSGKYDENNAIITIHAGTGGTDAQDFGEMLLRMYLKYAERMEFEVIVMDKSAGEEAGIKSVTFQVKGQFAYGYLKGERGIHRLVRLSPFNSKHTRETSFVLVEILPEIHFEDIDIKEDDLKIDVYRAGGCGGQGVNTTDSAVRITHIPTGLVVQCQNERSQLQNKEHAMKVLHSRIVDLMEEQQTDEIGKLRGEPKDIAWGNQIRSYVLHPYKMVKDHRTDYEENNPDAVFDGEIDGFIEAELKNAKFKY
ncbi:peptide chain release factor 2 [Candidatus Peregrinibacteria bacterium]|nr:peptide chain release factor 2 [Candidatus Peregrinibacteria bacterium]MBT7736374.1 peptide chain release factor 2 [Candidatus Peregrinibacteria bacterium]